MDARVLVSLLFGLVAASLFGAVALWTGRDEPAPTRSVAAQRSPAELAGRAIPERSEDPERASLAGARERNTATRPPESIHRSPASAREPAAGYRRPDRRWDRVFDAGSLAAIGFRQDDIDWIRARWEESELDRRDLAELEDRGEAAPPGLAVSDIDRKLRQDLGDAGYDAMLYATDQDNRVSVERLRDDSIARRAGIRAGDVVWSYDGRRIFDPRELAALSTTGSSGEKVEIVIVTADGSQSFFVDRRPLGVELVAARGFPEPY